MVYGAYESTSEYSSAAESMLSQDSANRNVLMGRKNVGISRGSRASSDASDSGSSVSGSIDPRSMPKSPPPPMEHEPAYEPNQRVVFMPIGESVRVKGFTVEYDKSANTWKCVFFRLQRQVFQWIKQDAINLMNPHERCAGTLIKWSQEKLFGFIAPDDDSGNVGLSCVYFSNENSFKDDPKAGEEPTTGWRVEFEIERTERGYRGRNVTRIHDKTNEESNRLAAIELSLLNEDFGEFFAELNDGIGSSASVHSQSEDEECDKFDEDSALEENEKYDSLPNRDFPLLQKLKTDPKRTRHRKSSYPHPGYLPRTPPTNRAQWKTARGGDKGARSCKILGNGVRLIDITETTFNRQVQKCHRKGRTAGSRRRGPRATRHNQVQDVHQERTAYVQTHDTGKQHPNPYAPAPARRHSPPNHGVTVNINAPNIQKTHVQGHAVYSPPARQHEYATHMKSPRMKQPYAGQQHAQPIITYGYNAVPTPAPTYYVPQYQTQHQTQQVYEQNAVTQDASQHRQIHAVQGTYAGYDQGHAQTQQYTQSPYHTFVAPMYQEYAFQPAAAQQVQQVAMMPVPPSPAALMPTTPYHFASPGQYTFSMSPAHPRTPLLHPNTSNIMFASPVMTPVQGPHDMQGTPTSGRGSQYVNTANPGQNTSTTAPATDAPAPVNAPAQKPSEQPGSPRQAPQAGLAAPVGSES